MLRLALALIAGGVVLAVLGNAWQERIGDGIRSQAVATGRVGEPLAVPKTAADLRIVLGPSGEAGDRVLERVDCEATAALRHQPRTGRGRVTKIADYTVVGTVEATGDPFTVRCTTGDSMLDRLVVRATTGGDWAWVTTFPFVGGILLACFGAAALLLTPLVRRKRVR